MKDTIGVIFLLMFIFGGVFYVAHELADTWEYSPGLYADQNSDKGE